MIPPRHILWGILLPALIALIATLLGQLGVRRERKTQPWGPALAIAGGFALAYVGIVGAAPSFPPAAAQGWLFYLAGAVVVIAAVAAMLRSRGWIDAMLSVMVLALAAWLLSRPQAQTLSPPAFWATVVMAAVGIVGWWMAMESLARRRPGGTLPLLLAGATGAAAIVLVNAHTQSLGQIAGGVAVVLTILALLGFWFRNFSLARGGMLA